MTFQDKIFVAGGTGLVGSAIIRQLQTQGYTNIVSSFNRRQPDADKSIQYVKLNLINEQKVKDFYQQFRPDYVFLAAARVGGIIANSTYRAQFLYENLQIQNNIIHQAYLHNVKKLLFLGSSCIYPKNCPQPMKEDYMLTGELEYTNEPYAIAKITGMKMCESYNLQYGTNFISVMPTNLYGLRDNYHPVNSHVLPAFIRKLHWASCLQQNNLNAIRSDFKKRPVDGFDGQVPDDAILDKLSQFGINNSQDVELRLWGSGNPRREFLHSDDLADACIFLMNNVEFGDILQKEFNVRRPAMPPEQNIRNTHVNIGTGKDIQIRELAELIQKITGFAGKITWDSSKPDGTPQKLLDVSKLLSYGWSPKIPFEEGVRTVYQDFVSSG